MHEIKSVKCVTSQNQNLPAFSKLTGDNVKPWQSISNAYILEIANKKQKHRRNNSNFSGLSALTGYVCYVDFVKK